MPFVSLEGIDGCGKSTQADMLVRRLRAAGLSVVQTKEPDGGRLGKAVKSILTDANLAGRLSPVEELLLVSAARYDHVRSVIEPALARSQWVVCDRFYDSTYALQTFELSTPLDLFEVVTRAVAGIRPDITFVLDIPIELALSRRRARTGSGQNDPAELSRDFGRIRNGFLRAAAISPERCRVIDASGDVDTVGRKISEILAAKFSDRE